MVCHDCPEVEIHERRRMQKHDMKEVATMAVKETLAILGVNIDNPNEIEEFRRDLRFSKDMRKAIERGKLALFVFIVTALAGWALIKLGAK